MNRQRFFPRQAPDQSVWLLNFADKITAALTATGLGAKAVATVADALWLAYLLGPWYSQTRIFAKTATAALELAQMSRAQPGAAAFEPPVFVSPPLPTGVVPVPSGALRRIFRVIRQLKEADEYTTSMGEELSVIAPEKGPGPEAPRFRLALVGGQGGQAAELRFTKSGHEGVYIQSRRGGGDWEFLAIDTRKPFIDARPLLVSGAPEVREYRLRFWDKGEPNGPWSNVASLTVAP